MQSINTQNIQNPKNAGLLLIKAAELGMTMTDSYGELGYNDTYGNTYLWIEYYQFTLLINDYDDTIKALYTCFIDGTETEFYIDENTDLETLETWAENLSNESMKKEEDSD